MENVQIIAYRFNYPDELEHAGTKGMKWGRRLYQNKDGSLTPLGRAHYGIKTKRTAKKRAESLAKAREVKAAKKQAAEEEAKKKAEQEAAEAKEREAREAEKQRVIKSGTAAEALNLVGDLSPQEMQYISNRIQWEQNMKNITAKETAEGKSKTDEFFKSMDKAVGYAQTGAKMYNTVANVVNAFNGEKVMPKIDTDITKGNKQDIKNRKKDLKKQREAAEKRAQQEAEGDSKRAERAKKKAETEKQNADNNQQSTQSKKEQKAQAKAEKKAAKEQAKKDKKERTTQQESEIIGEGTSKSSIKNESNNTKKDKPSDYYDPIDMYDGEVPITWRSPAGNDYREVKINGVTVREYIDRL